MKAYIGNTDHGWFNYLDSLDPTPVDINFWRPSDSKNFNSIEVGALFFFRLKSPIHRIGGFGFFSQYTKLPVSTAWEYFGTGNGHETFEQFADAIQHYRRKNGKPFEYDPTIGCIVLSNPVFFHQNDYLPLPANWPMASVQGKSYDIDDPNLKLILKNTEQTINAYMQTDSMAADSGAVMQNPIRFNLSEQKVRIGQGAFRATILETHNRQCCVTGERAIPVLEAAHIRQHARGGPHDPDNGILLRVDLHKLFDAGYLTITHELRLKVSHRLREDYRSGDEYQKLHGKALLLPSRKRDHPSPAYIQWHHDNVFRK